MGRTAAAMAALALMTVHASGQEGDALDRLYRDMMERQFPGQTLLNNCLATYLDPVGPPDRDTLATYLGDPDFDPAAQPPEQVRAIFEQLPPQDAYFAACKEAVDSVGPLPDVAVSQPESDALDRYFRGLLEQEFPDRPQLIDCMMSYFDPLPQSQRDTFAPYLASPDFDPAQDPPPHLVSIFDQLTPSQDAYFEACVAAVDGNGDMPAPSRLRFEGDAFGRFYRGTLERRFPGETALVDCMMTAFDVLSESQREGLVAYASDPDFDPRAAPPQNVLDISASMPPQDVYLAACREAVSGDGKMPDPAAFVPGQRADWPPDGETVGLVAVDREGSIEHFLMATMGMELQALSRARSIDSDFRLRTQGGAQDARGFVNYLMVPPDGRTLGQLKPMANFNFNWTPDENYPTYSFGADDFTAIAQFAFDPTTVHVAADSPLTDIAHLVAVLKDDPGIYSISCGGPCSGGWDVPFVKMLMDEGVDVSGLRLVSDRNLGEGIDALLKGDVDVYLGSIRTSTILPEPDRIRTIAVMSDSPVPFEPEAKLVGDWLGTSYVGGMWYGVAAGPGMDPALVGQIAESIRIVTEHENYRTQMEAVGVSVKFLGHEDFTRRLERHFEDAAATYEAIHAP
jgi:tripartite-type tricarboxylate transporter receptor subunit TctC